MIWISGSRRESDYGRVDYPQDAKRGSELGQREEGGPIVQTDGDRREVLPLVKASYNPLGPWPTGLLLTTEAGDSPPWDGHLMMLAPN